MASNPSNPAELYASLLTVELAGLSGTESLGVIGSLIDLSDDLGKPDGARRALELSDLLEATKLPEADAALLEYFRANAWSVLQRHEPTNVWDWEQPALGKQIFYLRKCVCHPAFSKLDKLRRCQVFTNLGNCMDTVGRFIEAQEYWGQALTLEPKFGMAVGNKGCGLETYARALYDPGHRMLFVKFAHAAVKLAIGKKVLFDGVYPQALIHFESVKYIITIVSSHGCPSIRSKTLSRTNYIYAVRKHRLLGAGEQVEDQDSGITSRADQIWWRLFRA